MEDTLHGPLQLFSEVMGIDAVIQAATEYQELCNLSDDHPTKERALYRFRQAQIAMTAKLVGLPCGAAAIALIASRIF